MRPAPLPPHLRAASLAARRRETRDKAGADDAFFNYLRAHHTYTTGHWRRSEFRIANDQLGWFSHSDFALACGRPQFRANGPLGNLAIKPKSRPLELGSQLNCLFDGIV
jgi:hypothetical protein